VLFEQALANVFSVGAYKSDSPLVLTAGMRMHTPTRSGIRDSVQHAKLVAGNLARSLLTDSIKKLCITVFMVLPLIVLLLGAIFGAILALAEGWGFDVCFWSVVQELTGTSIPVEQYGTPDTHFGKIVGCLIGLCSLAVLGIMLAIIGGPLLEPIIEAFALKPTKEVGALRESVMKLSFFIFVAVPLLSVVLSALFGLLLSAIEGGAEEGWPFIVCFYLVLAELTATDLPIVKAPYPKRTAGKLIVCFVGLWSLAIFGLVLGITGGPLLEPIIHALGATPSEKRILPPWWSRLLGRNPAKKKSGHAVAGGEEDGTASVQLEEGGGKQTEEGHPQASTTGGVVI
jgi:hypothetical protein